MRVEVRGCGCRENRGRMRSDQNRRTSHEMVGFDGSLGRLVTGSIPAQRSGNCRAPHDRGCAVIVRSQIH